MLILLPFLFQVVLCDTLDDEKENDSESIFNLGLCYYNGKECERNYAQAVVYFEKAAKLGNTKAILQLSDCYLFGFGVEKNLTKAVEYYEKSGNLQDTKNISTSYFATVYRENGNDLDYIGDCYYLGINGYELDYQKAFEYFEKAAKLNNTHSINRLAQSYYEGIIIEKNISKSIEYFKQSAELNNTFALFKLGVLYFLGTEIQQNYTKSYEYFLKGSELNDPNLLNFLGTFYLDDRIGKKNVTKAIECFSKSLVIDKILLYSILGKYYGNGFPTLTEDIFKSVESFLQLFQNAFGCSFHTKINEKIIKMIEYYDRTIQFDDPKCCYFVIKYFLENKEYQKAIDYLELAAKSNNSKAIMLLGVFYRYSIGVDYNITKSIECFKLAEKLGNSDAVVNLGTYYFNGEGFEQNKEKSIQYFKKAQILGNPRAYKELYMAYFGQSNDFELMFKYNEIACKAGHSGGIVGLIWTIIGYLSHNNGGV